MSLETAQYINSLDSSNPTGLDSRTTADDHLRLIKASLKRTFANVTDAVVASHTELNYTMALSSTAQDQINTLIDGKMNNSATAAFAISAWYAQSAAYAESATRAISAIYANSASEAGCAIYAASAQRAVQLQHAGNVTVSAADYTSIGTGAKILDGAGNQQPVGLNVTPIVPVAVSTALRVTNAGMHIYGNSPGITISIDTTTNNAPVGSSWIVSNFQTQPTTMSITCTGSILYWFDGIGAPSTGTRTLAAYGWCQITFYGGGYMIVGVGLT